MAVRWASQTRGASFAVNRPDLGGTSQLLTAPSKICAGVASQWRISPGGGTLAIATLQSTWGSQTISCNGTSFEVVPRQNPIPHQGFTARYTQN
jgi:hypothetical protein